MIRKLKVKFNVVHNIIGLIYCRHKFVLAYLPVIAFYHWGKVIYRFDLEDSYEKMTDQIVKMTGKVCYFLC